MPANIPNAVCGPQVNNTATAPPGTDLSKLNECPLNACCDIWGQCGSVYPDASSCVSSDSVTGQLLSSAPSPIRPLALPAQLHLDRMAAFQTVVRKSSHQVVLLSTTRLHISKDGIGNVRV
jgi:hypothetical protein